MNRLRLLIAATFIPLLGGGALAQNTDAARLQTRALAATCATCHGTEGRAVEGAAMVPLAAMPKAYMVNQLKAFQDGTRSATVMHQLAKGYTDAQIDNLATYFAAVPAKAVH